MSCSPASVAQYFAQTINQRSLWICSSSKFHRVVNWCRPVASLIMMRISWIPSVCCRLRPSWTNSTENTWQKHNDSCLSQSIVIRQAFGFGTMVERGKCGQETVSVDIACEECNDPRFLLSPSLRSIHAKFQCQRRGCQGPRKKIRGR